MNKELILDLETDGLEYTKVHCVVCFDVNTRRGTQFIPDTLFDSGAEIPEYVSKNTDTFPLREFSSFVKDVDRLVMHNGIAFDAQVMKDVLGVSVPFRAIFDTLITSRLLFIERPKHSVESYGEQFGIPKPEHEEWDKFSWGMLKRCRDDVRIQYKIYRYHLEKISRKNIPYEVLEREFLTQRFMLQQKKNGFFLDAKKATELRDDLEQKVDQYTTDIRRVFPTVPVNKGLFEPKVKKDGTISRIGTKWLKPFLWTLQHHRGFHSVSEVDLIGGPCSKIEYQEFNLDSPPQRIDRLTKAGWKPTQFTPKGNPKFDEKDLETNPDLPPEARLLGTYLMTVSRLRTVRQWLDLKDSKGYVHGSVITLGARTHRMAHQNPNMGNVPRVGSPYGEEFRSCWTIEDTARNVLLGVDASGIQLRALAHYVNNEEYSHQMVEGDIHQVHADALGVPRDVAKTFIYAWVLNAGVTKLGQIIGGTKKDGADANERFLDRMPFLADVKRVFERYGENGEFKALDGRWIYVPSAHLSLSTGLQSFETIVMREVMIRYHRWCYKNNIWFKQRNLVHDEFQIETHKEHAEELGNRIKNLFFEVGEYFGSKCPLGGDAKMGTTWAMTH